MNIVARFFTERGARVDARSGLDSVEQRIIAELGPRPELDQKNTEHRTLIAALADRARIDELREDVTNAEDALARHTRPRLLMAGLIVTTAIEVLGAILIMRALGVPPAERLPLGFALALALIGITAVAAHRAATPSAPTQAGATGAEPTTPPRRSRWTLLLLLAYAAIVVAIAVVRIQNATDEDASQLEIVAQAFLMLATSVGPAWIAEWLMRRRAPARAVEKRLRVLRRRLLEAERLRRRAENEVNRIAREGQRWDAETARRRALYTTHHRLEQARRNA